MPPRSTTTRTCSSQVAAAYEKFVFQRILTRETLVPPG